MFEALRKYSSVVTLVLMGLVLVCLVADEYGDAQQLAKQTVSSACMSVIGDDFDWDEDDDDDVVTTSFDEAKDWMSTPMLETCDQKTERSKCSMALLRGQVRRYSPRNNLSDSHNYTLLSITKSGVDLFHATFFMQFTPLLTKRSNKNEKAKHHRCHCSNDLLWNGLHGKRPHWGQHVQLP